MARPRSSEARRKAIEATTGLLVERGVGAVTIEEVAARSGVAKTTIYRHWPDRSTLILDTIRSHFEHIGSPDTGTLRGDLEAFFGLVGRRDLSGPLGEIMPCMIDAATRDAEVAALLDQLGAERQASVERFIARARERGELTTDLPVDDLVGVLIGPIIFQKVIRRRPLTVDYVDRCIDVALAGIAALNTNAAAENEIVGSAKALPTVVD